MPNYHYFCEACSQETEAHYKLSETRPDTITCVHCQELAEYRIASPMVMNASLPDGSKRKGFQDLKEAARLHVEALDKPPADRAGYYNEMNKLKSIKK